MTKYQVKSAVIFQELEFLKGVNINKLGPIRGSMLYVPITYQNMTPYMKGVHLKLDGFHIGRH